MADWSFWYFGVIDNVAHLIRLWQTQIFNKENLTSRNWMIRDAIVATIT